jgi:aspartyl aminopeptidase
MLWIMNGLNDCYVDHVRRFDSVAWQHFQNQISSPCGSHQGGVAAQMTNTLLEVSSC